MSSLSNNRSLIFVILSSFGLDETDINPIRRIESLCWNYWREGKHAPPPELLAKEDINLELLTTILST